MAGTVDSSPPKDLPLETEEAVTHPLASATHARADWRGDERYRVVRRIGQGGMGTVYEAFDRERGESVAVKSLIHFSPAALYRFKQEFRTLGDVRHPNLVRLHELVVGDARRVFFSMELVRGTDFLTHVQRAGARRAAPAGSSGSSDEPTRAERSSTKDVGSGAGEPAQSPAPAPPATPADLEKLRPALRQLVEGLMALHAAGKMHRDIKPSNVLVEPGGRVVILDFGVAAELARVVDEKLSEEIEVVGTARYMAPEQGLSEALTPASDWYSVGVVLYEALVGRPPFSGSTADVITLKTLRDPAPPSECVTGVPPELDALCRALLDRFPGNRPGGREILGALDQTWADGSRSSLLGHDVAEPILVGREVQLAALRRAFDDAASGRATTVRIRGGSGLGKSALANHFLDGLVERGEAVVLRGRAYERESVPYKAVDGVIDALSRYLIHLEEAAPLAALPRDVGALARVFPVLRRVPRIARVPEPAGLDPQQERRLAFSALREMLALLASAQPLVVSIDDVQWGDADSAALLLDLVRPPHAPPVLFVMTHPNDEAAASPFLRELGERWPEGPSIVDLRVGPLDPADAERLALALLDGSHEAAQELARAVAREAAGSPFLVEELVRSHLGASRGDALEALTLEEMIRGRFERLPEDARRLLETAVVAGRPLPAPVLGRASGAGDLRDEAITALRARRFVRIGLRAGLEVVEIAHDRFRETILAGLSADRAREIHRRLAEVLEALPALDAEAIGMHLLGAGENARAAAHLERAAEEASEKLAFDQAVRLLRLALDAATASASAPEQTRRLKALLAGAIVLTGRGEEAARTYLDAARDAPPLERAELERAAATELFSSGRMVEGATVLHRVLAAAGLTAPGSAAGAVFWLVVYRVRLWLAFLLGFPFQDRRTEEIPRLQRARVDAVFAASIGFGFTDVLLGTYMAARGLVMALRWGDGFQILRAAMTEASQHAAIGGRPGRLERALVDVSRRLAEEDGTVPAVNFLKGDLGVVAYLRGEWRRALALSDEAVAGTIRHDHSAGWQTIAKVFACWSLNFLGEHRELAERHASLLADARERGDIYTSVQLRDGSLAILWLAADDPEGARRNAHEAIALWPRDRYLLQHWHLLYGECEIELYRGDGAAAYARMERDDRDLKRSLLLQVQHVRAQTTFLRGRCAIASIEAQPELRSPRLEEARRLAGRLERERMAWCAPLAAILRAAVASAENDRREAAERLRAAIDLAGAADMAGYATAARYQLGRLLGGEEGRALVQQAGAAMAEQGIRVPARFAATLVPGAWDPAHA